MVSLYVGLPQEILVQLVLEETAKSPIRERTREVCTGSKPRTVLSRATSAKKTSLAAELSQIGVTS